MLSVEVPPLCLPVLVGNPKGQPGNLLTWAEKIPKNKQVMSWGIPAYKEGMLMSEILTKTIERALQEGWGSVHDSFESAESHLNSLGIEDTKRIGNLVVPKDNDLLGSMILIEDYCFPVIHNLKRALCIVQKESK